MKTLNWRVWLWQYVVPLLILVVVPLALFYGLAMDEGQGMFVMYVVTPVLAFVSGWLFRPRHAWVVPAIVAGAPLVPVFVNYYVFGRSNFQVFHPVTLVVFSVLLGFLPMTVLMWLGRELGQVISNQLRRHRGPHAPAS